MSVSSGNHWTRSPCQLLTALTILAEGCTSEGSLLQLVLLFWPKIDRVPCETGGGKCEKNGAGYEVVCVTCQRAGRKTCCYGESGKNGYICGGEHRAACRLKNEENALYKHCLLEHGGMQAEFSMRVSGEASE